MSVWDWICYALSREHREYIDLRNEHYLRSGFSFDAIGTVRGEGDFGVALRVSGNATVLDRDAFVRNEALRPEKRKRFAEFVLGHVDIRMTALRYFCLYHPQSTNGPASPEFYRFLADENRDWRCERDPNLVDLAHDVPTPSSRSTESGWQCS
jgi:hypothetical protein